MRIFKNSNTLYSHLLSDLQQDLPNKVFIFTFGSKFNWLSVSINSIFCVDGVSLNMLS